MLQRRAQRRLLASVYRGSRGAAAPRALAYEAAGERRNAIAAWTALDQLQPDAEIEEHLVDLRCDPANSELRNDGLGREPVAPWPRRLDDPFPEVSDRPPEVPADQLTMEVLGEQSCTTDLSSSADCCRLIEPSSFAPRSTGCSPDARRTCRGLRTRKRRRGTSPAHNGMPPSR